MIKHGKVVIICGGGGGSGKTILAEALLRLLPGWAAVKIQPTELYAGVAVETETAGGKDTQRFRRAGAEPVLFLRAPAWDANDCLEQAFAYIPQDRGVLIEGRQALKSVPWATVIFVWRPGLAGAKDDWAERAAEAHLIFINRESEDADPVSIAAKQSTTIISGNLGRGLDETLIRKLDFFLRQRGLK